MLIIKKRKKRKREIDIQMEGTKIKIVKHMNHLSQITFQLSGRIHPTPPTVGQELGWKQS